jgi:DNA-binding transcriptional ArsR family regulator
MMIEGSTPLEMKAKLFRALGDRSRLGVLEVLRDSSKCVSEIVETTGLSQPNVSGHLAFLRDCGLVKREQRGRFAYYSLRGSNVEAILAAADVLLDREEPRQHDHSSCWF